MPTNIDLSVLDAGIVFFTVQLRDRIFLTVPNSPTSILLQWMISGTKFYLYTVDDQ